jgi:hypothetical protein
MWQDATQTTFTDVFIKLPALATSLTKLRLMLMTSVAVSVISHWYSVGHRRDSWHDLHLIRPAGILFTDPRAASAA